MNAVVATSESPSSPRLKITEIFYSLQGESRTVGLPTVFVRLTGCPLRCHYCDSAYAFHGGDWWSVQAICDRVAEWAPRYITVTGGEPLAQKNVHALLAQLCDTGYEVSLETSGALDLSGVDARVIKVVDLKTPASGESDRNRWENLALLTPRDQIKMVVCDRADYEWAKTQITTHDLASRCEVLISPSYQQLSPSDLAEWILADRLPVRFQLQLHKLLWGEAPGR